MCHVCHLASEWNIFIDWYIHRSISALYFDKHSHTHKVDLWFYILSRCSLQRKWKLFVWFAFVCACSVYEFKWKTFIFGVWKIIKFKSLVYSSAECLKLKFMEFLFIMRWNALRIIHWRHLVWIFLFGNIIHMFAHIPNGFWISWMSWMCVVCNIHLKYAAGTHHHHHSMKRPLDSIQTQIAFNSRDKNRREKKKHTKLNNINKKLLR